MQGVDFAQDEWEPGAADMLGADEYGVLLLAQSAIDATGFQSVCMGQFLPILKVVRVAGGHSPCRAIFLHSRAR